MDRRIAIKKEVTRDGGGKGNAKGNWKDGKKMIMEMEEKYRDGKEMTEEAKEMRKKTIEKERRCTEEAKEMLKNCRDGKKTMNMEENY